MTSIQGVIHGKTIELEHAPGLPEGQKVAVEIRPVEETPRWLERFVVDPAVVRGKLLVKGTRLLAEDLAGFVEAGHSDEEMLRQYPELAVEDIAALREYVRVPAGLRRSFGGWAEDAEELDRYLDWTRQQRKAKRREIEA